MRSRCWGVLACLTLAVFVTHGRVSLSDGCAQSLPQVVASGDPLLYAFGVLHELGRYDICRTLTSSRFCTATLAVMCVHHDNTTEPLLGVNRCSYAPVLGLCVPNRTSCPTELLAQQVTSSTATNAGFQAMFGPSSPCVEMPSNKACDTNRSFGYFDVTCMDELPRMFEDTSATIVFAVVLFLAVFGCVAAAINSMSSSAAVPPSGAAASAKGGVSNETPQPLSTMSMLPVRTASLRRWSGDADARGLGDGNVAEGRGGGGKVAAVTLQEGGESSVAATTAAASSPGILLLGSPTWTSDVATTTKSKGGASPQRPSWWLTVAGWFDVLQNLREFVAPVGHCHRRTAKSVPGAMELDTSFFEGVRIVAMLFVIYGHSLYYRALGNPYDRAAIGEFIVSYASILSTPVELAVDTFFFLSGFLFMHTYLKRSERVAATEHLPHLPHPTIGAIAKLYLHRYLRMTPVVAVAMALAMFVLPYVPTGTMHSTYRLQAFITSCSESWWRQYLYITNLDDADGWNSCMGWLWYLSADFQMYLCGPVVAAVYFFHRRLWYLLVAAMILVVAGVQLQSGDGAYFGGGGTIYDKTYSRCNGFLYGMLGATLVRVPRIRELMAMHVWKRRLLCSAGGTGMLLLCIHAMWLGTRCDPQLITDPPSCPPHFHRWVSSAIVVLWGLGLLLISLPWCFGHERTNIIKSILSHRALGVVAQLTYCCYILHPTVLVLVVADGFEYPALSAQLLVANFSAAAAITLPSALVLHILVERPFAKLNDALTRG